MATLDTLKRALRQESTAMGSLPKQSLSDRQYSDGLDILQQGIGSMTYRDFIIPQLSRLVAPLFHSHVNISVLEIGPGLRSVFGCLPGHLRRRIRRYAAFEPNELIATKLEKWFCSTSETEAPLPCLESPPDIRRVSFDLASNDISGTSSDTHESKEKFDVILFCHSMYGLKSKARFVERALEMLVGGPKGEWWWFSTATSPCGSTD
ncbi:uncharacterized protein N7500_007115 [Penicillium coprophilum]|uniref:uncharacterized protein n=1 Tax=Penicillium coprophilum TaxID=36646 RepID=UPI0023907569|nr:uncharacterized protein N7500_007115 [Penicillium coprophilum]KAJ5165285.1 hypothetical protein N7500_007115 [Penicillium coprophilum]